MKKRMQLTILGGMPQRNPFFIPPATFRNRRAANPRRPAQAV
jgi:hypothetical protein